MLFITTHLKQEDAKIKCKKVGKAIPVSTKQKKASIFL